MGVHSFTLVAAINGIWGGYLVSTEDTCACSDCGIGLLKWNQIDFQNLYFPGTLIAQNQIG